MNIAIKIAPVLLQYSDNQPEVLVKGSTVSECLDHLVSQFPALKEALFDKHGELRNYLEIYINQESAYPGELDKPVHDGDELHIATVLVGG